MNIVTTQLFGTNMDVFKIWTTDSQNIGEIGPWTINVGPSDAIAWEETGEMRYCYTAMIDKN